MGGGALFEGGALYGGGAHYVGGVCAVPEEKGTKASFFWKRPLPSRKLAGLKLSGKRNMAGSCSAVLSSG